jgi:hypothetical protein
MSWRFAVATRQKPALSVCPVFKPSTLGSVNNRSLRFLWWILFQKKSFCEK